MEIVEDDSVGQAPRIPEEVPATPSPGVGQGEVVPEELEDDEEEEDPGDDLEDYDVIDEEDDFRYDSKRGKDEAAKIENVAETEYDEETQKLVDIAEEARKEFQEVEREVIRSDFT